MKAIIKTSVGLGTPTDIEFDPKELVKNLKERAAVTQATDASSVVLMYEGTILDDNKRLKEYGIREGATLELMPKHQKGGYIPSSIFCQGLPMDFNSRVAHESKLIRARGLPMKPINPYHWVALIRGKGKWSGKNYKVDITLPDYYPYSAPKVDWRTPMKPFHPNIFTHSGWVCLNILDRDWRPDYTLITVYNSLEWLLEHPHYEHFDRVVHSIIQYAGRRHR